MPRPSLIFLLLPLVLPAGPAHAAAGLQVRVPHAWSGCEEYLVEVDPASVYEVGTQNPPDFHAANLDAALTELTAREHASLRRLDFKGRAAFLCAEAFACFAVTDEKKLRSRVRFRVRDLLGRRYEFKARPDPKDSSLYWFNPARLRPAMPPRADLAERRQLLWRIYGEKRYWAKSFGELAVELHYLFYASSARAQKHSQSAELDRGVRRAHELFTENLQQGIGLTVDDLEAWNYHLSRGPEAAPPLSAGVLRGSRSRAVEINGVLHLLDLRRAEVWQGTADQNPVMLNPFTPASRVAAATDLLLREVNAVNESTPPTRIFALYREFILIHPFADRNGGTGRLLLNHMLLRAGLPPTLKPSESLYFSDDELFTQYADRWEKKTRRAGR